tara:strand:- start:252 stop:578 length:327 start_codon:yes stop_codon:yes gene_type:complete
MVKKVLKKLGKGLKKAAPILALAGAAALAGRRGRAAKAMQNSVTADMDRSMVPMDKRMVQGLNFPMGTDLSGISKLAEVGSIDKLKKGGRVGCGKAKRGFGRAMKRRK